MEMPTPTVSRICISPKRVQTPDRRNCRYLFISMVEAFCLERNRRGIRWQKRRPALPTGLIFSWKRGLLWSALITLSPRNTVSHFFVQSALKLKAKLDDAGVPCTVYYPPLSMGTFDHGFLAETKTPAGKEGNEMLMKFVDEAL